MHKKYLGSRSCKYLNEIKDFILLGGIISYQSNDSTRINHILFKDICDKNCMVLIKSGTVLRKYSRKLYKDNLNDNYRSYLDS